MLSTLRRYKQNLSQDRLETMRDRLSHNLDAPASSSTENISSIMSLQTQSTPDLTIETSPEVASDIVSSPALSGTSDTSWPPSHISTFRRARYKVGDWITLIFARREPQYDTSNSFPPLRPRLYSGVQSPRGTRYDEAGRPFLGPKERPVVWISTEVIVQRFRDPAKSERRRPVF